MLLVVFSASVLILFYNRKPSSYMHLLQLPAWTANHSAINKFTALVIDYNTTVSTNKLPATTDNTSKTTASIKVKVKQSTCIAPCMVYKPL